jgi:hypothetical protein
MSFSVFFAPLRLKKALEAGATSIRTGAHLPLKSGFLLRLSWTAMAAGRIGK